MMGTPRGHGQGLSARVTHPDAAGPDQAGRRSALPPPGSGQSQL